MDLKSAWRDWRVKVHETLEVDSDTPESRVVNAFLIVLILANGVAFAAETVDSLAAKYGPEFEAFNTFSVIIFTVEYVLRLWGAVEIPMFRGLPHWRARLRFALRPMMLIDLMAFLPWYLYSIIPVDLRAFRVIRIFRLLKLLRYSPALETLKRVVINERRALIGGLLLMMVLLLFTSSIIYFIERDAQPNEFGSIPAAAWWSLATLTTIGYGDIVPATPWGKVFGGLVMLIGLGMFALPIAIISAGFSQESARNEFVASWTAVARIPLFSELKANEIAEISKLVYTRLVQPGAAIVTAGQSGGAMYFICSGEASVQVPPGRRVELHEGDFFGEMALLEHRRHKHDVIADTPCRVFVLDSEALARLSRRHPHIARHIREVAKERERDNRQAAKRVRGPQSKKAAREPADEKAEGSKS